MKFYEEHATFHHFKHNPHKWFAAILISPLHHAEMRYKQTYHLRFAHAKKLFVFDMMLILSTILLFGATLFWWLYDPTVTALVHLDVTAEGENNRFRSGDDMTLTITYKNESDVTLTQPKLIVHTNPGFLITSSSQPYTLEKDNAIHIEIASLPPGAIGHSTITGQLFSPQHEHATINTTLIYTQEGKQTPESDVHRLYVTTREKGLSIAFEGPPQYIANASIPILIRVTNEQDFVFPDLDIDLKESHEYATWKEATSTEGILDLEAKIWHISGLLPHATATLSGTIHIAPPSGTKSLPWFFVPKIYIPTLSYPLPESEHSIILPFASPQVRISSSWNNKVAKLGQQALLEVSIHNTGDAPLENPRISILGKTVTFDKNVLHIGETLTVSVNTKVDTDNVIQTTDGPIFSPTISFEAGLPSIPSYTYHTTTDAPPLPIGTTLSMTQSSRYYTEEGDQLGRGPLPPQVGKETKYWVFTQLKNTVGALEDISFSTTLAPGAVWTGKSSVSRSGNITYDPATRKATWYARSMNPYETIGIYFEIAVTPQDSDRGTIPALTSGATVSARDPYIDDNLSASTGPVQASLVGDPLGQAKGVQVQ